MVSQYAFANIGPGSPIVVGALLLILVLLQVFSGCLFNMRFGTWAIRKERPNLFWAVISIEFCIALFILIVAIL